MDIDEKIGAVDWANLGVFEIADEVKRIVSEVQNNMRKPLSEVQLSEITTLGYLTSSDIKFARAIEKAHGIGE